MASQLTWRPVTSGGCRERVSVTSSCTHPLPLPGGQETRAGPPFSGRQARHGAALPSVLAAGARSPHTIVGKSRTTGSHYLTSVSSTIAKNGGRQAAGVGLGPGEVAACAERDRDSQHGPGGPGTGVLPTARTRPGTGAPSPQACAAPCAGMEAHPGGSPAQKAAPTRSQGTPEGTPLQTTSRALGLGPPLHQGVLSLPGFSGRPRT